MPKTCECGGKMHYEQSMGRVYGYCEKCTPVIEISIVELNLVLRRRLSKIMVKANGKVG